MHEIGIAAELIDQVLRLADEHRASHVAEVDVAIGVMQQVVPEALHTAFVAMTDGTTAEGAILRVTDIASRAICLRCGDEFPIEVDLYTCPMCNKAEAKIIEGDQIVLTSVVLDSVEDDAAS
jgi:hydrogenase nickel incorporation protein HypA/HybF